MVLRKTSSGHRIGKEFPSQRLLTENYTKLIRKIYNRDARLTPRQQQKLIVALSGITIDEMESIIKCTGPQLSQNLRKVLSAHRGTTKRAKEKARKRR